MPAYNLTFENGNFVISLARTGGQGATGPAGSDATVTTANVTAVVVGLAAGAVGTTALLTPQDDTVSFAFGETTAGTGLRASNAAGTKIGVALDGVWRCLGGTEVTSAASRTTQFLRIS